MALILFLLLIYPSFSAEKKNEILLYQKLKIEIENLEKSGTKQLNQKKIDSLNEIISKSENFKLDKKKYDFENMEERLNILVESWEKEKFTNIFYTSISFLTWTYPEKIKDPQGTTSMSSVESGYCLGGGIDWQNAYWGHGVDLCMAFMKADAGIKYGNQSFTDIGAPVYSIISKPNIFWRPGDKVKLLLFVPLVYRNALISGSEDIEILPQNKFFIGLFLGADWEFSNFFLSTSIGKIFEFESSSWFISLGYKFY
jgi:hypothetical protein